MSALTVSISRLIMKDSQRSFHFRLFYLKYIKADNERFSTLLPGMITTTLSISRLIMKDSQPGAGVLNCLTKYIKADNERFSTRPEEPVAQH